MISQSLFCNTLFDCRSREDEVFCHCEVFHEMDHCSVSATLSQFVPDATKQQFTPKKTTAALQVNMFTCFDGSKISIRNVNDGFPDCHKDEDEMMFKTSIKSYLLAKYLCKNMTHIQCYEGFDRCFPVEKLCTHEIDRLRNSAVCRNGYHLKSCTEFQCNGMFKCPRSFCILFKHVCDGHWECETGDDEVQCLESQRDCNGLFKCQNSRPATCVHLMDVCDTNLDCPHGDDEVICFPHKETCPDFCSCFGFAASCKVASRTKLKSSGLFLSHLLFVHICNSRMDRNVVGEFTSAQVFVFQDSDINRFCANDGTSGLPKLQLLFMQNGTLEVIGTSCFKKMRNLTKIVLQNLNTKTIGAAAFWDQTKLLLLDLSHNKLSFLRSSMFLNLLDLKELIVEANPISSVSVLWFSSVPALTVIRTGYFAVCCEVRADSDVICTASVKWPLSCSDILTKSMSSFIWVFVALTVFLNVFCPTLAGLKKKLTPYEVIVLFVHSSDLVCGLYLTVLAVANEYYAGNYFSREILWRKSFFCHFASFVTSSFSSMSPFVLLILTISRWLVVQYPLEEKHKRKKRVLSGCVLATGVSAGLSLWLWILFHFVENNTVLETPLCSFLGGKNSFSAKTFTGFVAVLLPTVCIVITILNISLLLEYRQTQKDICFRINVPDRNEGYIFVQIVVITTSNMLCWIPTAVVCFLTLIVCEYPTDMVIWTLIAVMPLNSVVNPSVFIFTKLKNIRPKQNTIV